MKPGIKWFKHDHTASNDEKILELRVEFDNWFGYGLFWAIIERLAVAKEHKLSKKKTNGLSLSLGVNADTLCSFIDKCIELELMQCDDEYFWSSRLNKDLENYEKISVTYKDRAKKAADARWSKKKPEVDNASSNASSIQQAKDKQSIKDATSKAEAKLEECSSNAIQDTIRNDTLPHSSLKQDSIRNNYNIEVPEDTKKELSSLSYLKICLEDKELWIDPVKHLEFKPKAMDAIAKYYVDLKKVNAKKNGKPVNTDSYVTSSKLALKGKNDWDVDNMLKEVQKSVKGRIDGIEKWLSGLEAAAREEAEQKRKSTLNAYAKQEFEKLSSEDRAEMEKTACDIVNRNIGGTYKHQPHHRQVRDRIYRMMYEDHISEEDAFKKKEEVNV